MHRSPGELGRRRQRRRGGVVVLVVLGLAALGSVVAMAWTTRVAPPPTTVVEIRPTTPPGGFEVPVEQMGPTLARLIPSTGDVPVPSRVTSTAYVDTSGPEGRGSHQLHRTVQMGSVVYDDGNRPSLVRVEVRGTTATSPSCPDSVRGCRRLADGTLVVSSRGVVTAAVAVADGQEVTVQQEAAESASALPAPLTSEELMAIATDPVWTG